jgi:hypothetical protein
MHVTSNASNYCDAHQATRFDPRLLGETEQPEARVGYNGFVDLMRRSKGVERISFSEG